MDAVESGYWDFYQDSAGYWRWRFACTDFEQVIASAKPHASNDECVQDAIEHGYNRFSDCRVTLAMG
jgi:uncharacterized protein YegP (UPF0339 family)